MIMTCPATRAIAFYRSSHHAPSKRRLTPEDERQPEEPGSEPEQDSDHNATGETMDDFLNGLDGAGGEE